LDSVKLLLESGANKNIQNQFGETAKSRAIKFENMEIAELLGEIRPEGQVNCFVGCTKAVQHEGEYASDVEIENEPKALRP